MRKRLTDELDWVRSNPKARQAKSKSRLARYEEMAAEAERTRKLDFEEIQIPGSAAGQRRRRGRGSEQGLRRSTADRRPVVLVAAQRHRRCDRSERCGQDDPVQDDCDGRRFSGTAADPAAEELPNAGAIRVGDTVSLSYVDQNRSGIDPKKNVWEVVSDGTDFINVGKVEVPSRAYVSAFGFKGPDQQKPAGCCPAASATGSIWR